MSLRRGRREGVGIERANKSSSPRRGFAGEVIGSELDEGVEEGKERKQGSDARDERDE